MWHDLGKEKLIHGKESITRHKIGDDNFFEEPRKSIRKQIEENSHKLLVVKSNKNAKYAAKYRNKTKF